MGLRNKQFARGSAGWLLIKSCKYKVSVDVCSLADPMQSRRCTFDPHGLTGAHDVYCSVPARKTISYGSFPSWQSRNFSRWNLSQKAADYLFLASLAIFWHLGKDGSGCFCFIHSFRFFLHDHVFTCSMPTWQRP